MDGDFLGGAGFTLAAALFAGVVAQSLARHVRLPGIVLLLLGGVLLGPEGAGLIQPRTLGDGLLVAVGFAVAVILFEGGMNLDLRRLRREAAPIRRLVTVGALVTAAGGAVAARWLMGWEWRIAILFGTLVVVTGPTVVTPLVRRIGVNRSLRTILEAEGVLIDAVGAFAAVVALEVVLELSAHPGAGALAAGARGLALRLGVGLGAGLAAGAFLVLALRIRRVVPEGLENVLALSAVLLVYQGAGELVPESGILAAIVAGMTVGNVRTPAQRGLFEFKEQLTSLLLGLIFILLAADVPLDEIRALGWAGAGVVLALMLVVRPLGAALSTYGTDLPLPDRAFVAWLAPRGIVAAAVSTLFAETLDGFGIPGGPERRALVFLVIGATVTVQGALGRPVARALGVLRAAGKGWVVLGASPLGRTLGRALRDHGEEVLFVDSNDAAAHAAEADGFRVFYGNGLEERTLARTEPDTRRGYVAATTNESVNMLFARKVREEHRVPNVLAAVQRGKPGVSPEAVAEVGGATLFGGPQDLPTWTGRCERGAVRVERWRLKKAAPVARPPESPAVPTAAEVGVAESGRGAEAMLLPLASVREGRAAPVSDRMRIAPGDEVAWLVLIERAAEAGRWLEEHGWEPVGPAPAAAAGA